MEQNILLTITMLVSNREDTIEKCMLSLKHLMEKIPSELIVVDTANNEKCMEVVKQYTENIVPFKWCDDFAAARNAGLERANGQWVMYLDDDEWFESTNEIESFFGQGIYKEYGSAAYITRNYYDNAGRGWSDRIAIRLCKLGNDVKFRGKIHEQLYPLGYPTYYMKDYVHHYGYVFANEEENMAHSWRNIRPLLERRKEDKDDFQAAGQLLQEYIIIGESYSAIELAKEMRMHVLANTPERIGFTSYAMVMEINIYQKLKQYNMAYSMAKEILAREDLLLITKGCLNGLMVGICYRLDKYKEGLKYIDEYERCFEIWSNNPKQHRTDFFSISEQFLCEDEKKRIQFLKLSLYIQLEKWEEAEKVLRKIEWNNTWKKMQIETPEDLVKLFLHNKKMKPTDKICIDAIKAMLKEPILCNKMYEVINKLNNEEKRVVLSFITQIELDNYELLKYHLEYYFMGNNKEEIERLLVFMQEKNYSFIIPQEDYWKALNRLGIDIEPYLDRIPMEDYFKLINALYAQMKLEICGEINQVLWKHLSKEDIRYKYTKATFLEKELFEKQEEMEAEEIWKYLLQISKLRMDCAKNLYQPEVFENQYFSALPSIYRFSWWIMQGEMHKNEISIHMKDVAEAVKCYLPLSDIVKKYLNGIQKLSQNVEFLDLSKKVKNEIHKLMEKGKIEEAEMILNQIMVMLPNDEECMMLQNMLQNRKGIF